MSLSSIKSLIVFDPDDRYKPFLYCIFDTPTSGRFLWTDEPNPLAITAFDEHNESFRQVLEKLEPEDRIIAAYSDLFITPLDITELQI